MNFLLGFFFFRGKLLVSGRVYTRNLPAFVGSRKTITIHFERNSKMSLNWVPVFTGIDNCSKLKHFQTSHRLIPLQQSVGWQHWWRSPKGVRTAVRICQATYWNFAAAIHQRLCLWDIKRCKKCNLHAEEEHFWKIDTLHPIYLKSSLQGLLAPWCHGLGQAPDLRWGLSNASKHLILTKPCFYGREGSKMWPLSCFSMILVAHLKIISTTRDI